MLKNRKSTIHSITLAAIWSLAGSIQIAAAKSPPNAQGLWVANGNHFSEFQGSALTSSGTPKARMNFGVKHYIVAYSMAFDANNNLWITALNNSRSGDVAIIEVRRADILSDQRGNVAKSRLVAPGGPGVKNTGWTGIGFDAADNLLVTNGGQQLLEVPPDQLESKIPSPAIVISSTIWFPWSLRFDSSDNLWVNVGNSQLWRFAPADRATSGVANPSLIVNLPFDFVVQDLAFDGSGNLWITGADVTVGALDEIKEISAGDLSGIGEITPAIAATITSSAFGSESGLGGFCLGGIDFDQSGDLWASARCQVPHLIEFTPSQLSTGGNLTPSITISPNRKKTNLEFPGPIRFGPAIK
jgi:hypothetical protein